MTAHRMCAIVVRYKLHVRAGRKGGGESIELYDLQADIRERNNLAPDRPEVVAQMRETLEAWQRSVERSIAGEDYR